MNDWLNDELNDFRINKYKYKLTKECMLLDIQTQQSFADWGKGHPGTGRRTMWDPGRTDQNRDHKAVQQLYCAKIWRKKRTAHQKKKSTYVHLSLHPAHLTGLLRKLFQVLKDAWLPVALHRSMLTLLACKKTNVLSPLLSNKCIFTNMCPASVTFSCISTC